eukprot:CAMPEP_0202343904 /NCGR_PEP_ID=MMETSP1126-20121109/3819_1 /ASSEMBLY_ACC=CAM_ASM_000457 /TAXON_ID=3047 /ORGANISM="Dunaliella tertiolecta, Strain CCMP1320" /LENGTH=33 /DNA_ID= /DNA_START= /DNA_END= /DNA_ORIENTATION=
MARGTAAYDVGPRLEASPRQAPYSPWPVPPGVG